MHCTPSSKPPIISKHYKARDPVNFTDKPISLPSNLLALPLSLPGCLQRSRGPGSPNVKLSVCTGCKVIVYCSKECQRAAWPEHKETCRRVQGSQQVNMTLTELAAARLASLNRFSMKHRETLTGISVVALEADVDPTNTETRVMWVVVKQRREPTRTAMSWTVSDAAIIPVEHIKRDMQVEISRRRRKIMEDEPEAVAVAVSIVQDEEMRACVEAFHTITSLEPWPRDSRPNWKNILMNTINSE